MKDGIEIFTMLYEEKITIDQCIEYTEDEDEDTDDWQYLLRDKNGNFNNAELFNKVLNKKYNFKLVYQDSIEKIIAEEQKQERIKQLEAELARLRGE